MMQPSDHRTAAVHYVPGRIDIIAALAASMAGWLLVVGALVEISLVLSNLGWTTATYVLLLCLSPQLAMMATRRLISAKNIVATVPTSMLDQRYHGSLDAISDSERRPLRPLGPAAGDVAMRSDILLEQLLAIPSVRIFRGLRTTGATAPPITHAISAGRTVILVESVAWPPGTYQIDEQGKISCQGRYIGQSVRPLLAAVRRWRRILPRDHRIYAFIIVHQTVAGTYQLPPPAPGVAWTTADEAIQRLRQLIPCGRQTVSRRTLASLIEATADHALIELRDDAAVGPEARRKGVSRYLWRS